MKVFRFSFSVALLIFAMLGCKKEEDTSMGSIVGFVQLYDDNNNKLQDKSGVTVTIEGTNFPQGLTDTSGRFEIKDIPKGVYNITFSKKEYSNCKIVAYNFLMSNYTGKINVDLYKPSTTKIEIIDAFIETNTDLNTIIVKRKITCPYSIAYYEFYCGIDPNVSYLNYRHRYYASCAEMYYTKNVNTLLISKEEFKSGTEIYITAYGSVQRDLLQGEILNDDDEFSGLSVNKSNVIKLVIP